MKFEKDDRVVIILDGDLSKCIMGTVLESKESEEDWSYHGSPYYPVITTVRGDDEKIYTDDRLSVNFMHPKNACERIQNRIEECNEESKTLQKMIWFILKKQLEE